MDFLDFLFLALGGFLASFINSVVGGGGLISMPVLIFLGIHPHTVLGTNKLAATSGSLTTSLYFIKNKKINWSILLMLIPFTFIGAILGVKTVILLNEKIVYIFICIVMILLSLYTYFSKNLGIKSTYNGLNKINIFLGISLAFSLGFYDGFLGPGTGSLLLFGLIKIFKLDFVLASGNSKVLNFISNVCALSLFMMNGKVNYVFGLIMAIFMVFGGVVGSKFAINKGVSFIKPIFILISIASTIGIIYQKLI